MILSSGDANMYDGAMFSYQGDFLGYLGLEDMGVYTAHGGRKRFNEKTGGTSRLWGEFEMIYKRFLSLLLVANMLCLLTMTSCAAAEVPAEDSSHPINTVTPQSQKSNILIAYFSRMGNTDFPDDIDAVTSASLLKSGGELYGNTQYYPFKSAAMRQACGSVR